MNDFVSNLNDYNGGDDDVEKLPHYLEDKIFEPLNCFYDFGADKPVRIGELRLDVDNATRFQKRLRELAKNL